MLRPLPFCAKRGAIFLATLAWVAQKEVNGMRVRSMGAIVASMMLVTMVAAGCGENKEAATRAEQAAARSEDAARRAESAASRVEAAAQRAEAAAEKAERMFSKHLRK
jgi:hypothetical protein